METIHVTFDELTGQTAPVLSSPRPAPNLLMPGPISSGLVPNPSPAIPYVPPTTNELETLFQPMFDEYFKNPPSARLVPPTPAVQVPVNQTGPSVSISVNPDAPMEINPFALADPEPFVNVFAPEPSSEASSSGWKLQTVEDLQGDALLHYDAEMELMNLILLSIPNDIYNSVDACTLAKDMWKRVERLIRGTIQNKVNRETHFWKRISDKRTKNQEKTDKTEHERKVKSKPKVKKTKSTQVNPDKVKVKGGADIEEIAQGQRIKGGDQLDWGPRQIKGQDGAWFPLTAKTQQTQEREGKELPAYKEKNEDREKYITRSRLI
ncbi:hypothetical protein Tco_0484625 [Tanacetum coccineum]